MLWASLKQIIAHSLTMRYLRELIDSNWQSLAKMGRASKPQRLSIEFKSRPQACQLKTMAI